MSLPGKFSQNVLFDCFIIFFSVSSLFRVSDIIRLEEDPEKLNDLPRVRRASKKEAWTWPQVFKIEYARCYITLALRLLEQ